jgi:peptide/nickel transport system substrate-binding protein
VKFHRAAVAPVVLASILCLAVPSARAAALPRSPAASAIEAGKPVLRIGMALIGTNLNPAIQTSDSLIPSITYSSLVVLEPNGALGPGLAISWQYVGTGNVTFELKLRPDVRFSDGESLTASAVKSWMTYVQNSKGAWSDEIPVKSITTVGTSTVVLHLSSPDPIVPYALTGGFAWGDVACPRSVTDPTSLAIETCGTGEYVSVPGATVLGSNYTFTPDPYYYDPAAIKFSQVEVKVISQPSTMLAAIESGQLDAAYGDITTAALAKRAGLNVITAPYGWDGINIVDRSGTDSKPFGSVLVRQALNYALNRPAIAKGLLGTYGVPDDELVTVDGWDPGYQNFYPYDPAKAKALLAEAGYPQGFSFDCLSQTFFGTLGDPVLEAMAQDFKAIGVTMHILSFTSTPEWANDILSGKYVASGYVQTPIVPMFDAWTFWLKPGALENFHGYADPVLDKLMDEALTAKSPASYWQAMARRTVVNADFIPVFEQQSFWYTTKSIGGVAFSAESSWPLPPEWYPVH